MPTPRLLLIGLDCAEPSLLFDAWAADLPHLTALRRRALYGRLESCIPAITVPAWSCMLSGRDPGELGIYGFRNRADRSYARMTVADARAVRVPRLWDLLGEAGWQVAVVSVPGTFPPPAVAGSLVSCFLAPNPQAGITHPPELAAQLPAWLGEDYLLDVDDFRSDDKARILREIYRLGNQRFDVAQHLLQDQRPDLLALVDMGVDRIHHAFWRHMDARHPLYVPDSPFAGAIHDYYVHIDRRVGELLAQVTPETTVLVVSDHGARPLMGGVRINQWLYQHGWLALDGEPEQAVPLDQAPVDWAQTRAWSAGGYYARIFLNVRGREPHGTIAPQGYAATRAELAAMLEAMPGPDGAPLGNRVFVPQQIYRAVRGIAPDLLVYLGDLAWRAIGTIGGDAGIYTRENDTGPDDANHAQHGLFIWYDPDAPGGGTELQGAQIFDILPSLLARFNVPAPSGLRGRSLF